MPRDRLCHLIVGGVAGSRLHQRQRDTILVHVGDQRVGVVDGRLGQTAIVEFRIAGPERDQVFRRLDVLAEVAIRGKAPDMRVSVNNHCRVLGG